MTQIKKETLRKMVKAIASTRGEEYDCDLCFEQLEKFVEMDLKGENAVSSFPLVKHHLDSCVGCGEEYRALLDAINGLESPVA